MAAKTKKSKAKPPELAPVTSGSLEISLPWVKTDKYAQTTLHLKMTSAQARYLRYVLEGLECNGAELANGRPVDSSQKAIMWLIEQVKAEVDNASDTAP